MTSTDAPHARAAHAASVAARTSYGRLLALLAASTGDIATAEDVLADAFERALRAWPDRGVPDNPDGWLLTVARNRLRDHYRSAHVRRTTTLDVDRDPPTYLDHVDPDAIPDKRLELLLVCAHPAIAVPARTPLMLNTVLGFTSAQIARAYAIPPATMATRLVRAKRRIRTNRIPFRLPNRDQLPARMDAVLEAVYGAYVIEWSTTEPEPRDLPPEALQLAEILSALVPDDPEAHGLAALVHLSAARAPARLDAGGRFVPLAEQDPQSWDTKLIDRAHQHLRAAHDHKTLGRFQLEAAIHAVHCARRDSGDTDWHTLYDLHRALYRVAPSLGAATALAAVAAHTDGPAAGLALLDDIADQTRRFQPAWATRAHLLAQLGRYDDADDAYHTAIALTHNPTDRYHLCAQRTALHTLRH